MNFGNFFILHQLSFFDSFLLVNLFVCFVVSFLFNLFRLFIHFHPFWYRQYWTGIGRLTQFDNIVFHHLVDLRSHCVSLQVCDRIRLFLEIYVFFKSDHTLVVLYLTRGVRKNMSISIVDLYELLCLVYTCLLYTSRCV